MTSPPIPSTTELLTHLAEEIPAAIDLRHRIHADPRVSGDEADTAALIVEGIGEPGIRQDSGALLVRVGDAAGPAVGIRGELDALPIVEQTSAAWGSGNGAMHACGHDVHMAALVAVTRALRAAHGSTPLVAVFQPREETSPSGALDIVGSGVLADQDVRAMVGVHVQPLLPSGVVSALPETINAAADEFDIVVEGTPGHGAYPHRTADPIVAAAHVVQGLQYLVSRQVDPMEPAVITVGSIHGGTAPNAIPDEVHLRGTLRTFTPQTRDRLAEAIEQTASALASAHGCRARVEVTFGEPPLTNDPALTLAIADELALYGFDTRGVLRSCGADDFAHYTEVMPATMVFYGVGTGQHDEPGLHSPQFLPADDHVEGVARSMLAAYLAASRVIGAPARR